MAWGLPDTLVVDGMSGLVAVSSRSCDGHSGGSSIARYSPQSSVVWGLGANIAVMRQFHEESGVAWCVTASMGIFGG